jgi:hypothetical protein
MRSLFVGSDASPLCDRIDAKMSSGFGEILGTPVKNVAIHVAEFSRDNNEYLEGPRMLSQSISFFPDQHRIEDVTYYADGTVHSREVIKIDAGSRKSILQRYKPDGELLDTWHIDYDRDGRRTTALAYGPDGKFRGESLAQDHQPVAPFLADTEDDPVESIQREVDGYGNWTREIRFKRLIEDGKVTNIPTMVTHRSITYFES